MSSHPRTLPTPEEYLMLERAAETRSEYLAGEIFALAGASREHNIITANVIRILGNQLVDRPCMVYPSDMRVKINPIRKYTYPDIAVTCGEEQFEDDHRDTLLNPMVIVEVLSESTEAYDRGKKFEHYQMLPSLAEYVLITQKPYRVEQYTRQNAHMWTYYECRQPADEVHLNAIGCTLTLEEIYAKLISSQSSNKN